jgi:hypothetical protein
MSRLTSSQDDSGAPYQGTAGHGGLISRLPSSQHDSRAPYQGTPSHGGLMSRLTSSQDDSGAPYQGTAGHGGLMSRLLSSQDDSGAPYQGTAGHGGLISRLPSSQHDSRAPYQGTASAQYCSPKSWRGLSSLPSRESSRLFLSRRMGDHHRRLPLSEEYRASAVPTWNLLNMAFRPCHLVTVG